MIDLTRLKDIREDKDISQSDIANILGVKRSTYSLWELGINIIPLNYLIKYASYFNYTIDYVLGLSTYRGKSKYKLDLDLVKLGNNLKQLRIDNNYKQKDIADMLGVSQACIAKYEKASIMITVPNLYKISKLYNKNIEDICFK